MPFGCILVKHLVRFDVEFRFHVLKKVIGKYIGNAIADIIDLDERGNPCKRK